MQGSQSSGRDLLMNPKLHLSQPTLDNLHTLSNNSKDGFHIACLFAVNVTMHRGHSKCLLDLFKCTTISVLLMTWNLLFLSFQHDTQLNSHHPGYLHSLLQMCVAAEDRPLRLNVSHGAVVQNRWKWTLPHPVHAWQVKITYASAVPSVTTPVQVFYFAFIIFFLNSRW